MTAPFDPKRFNDRYEEALVEFLKTKQAGQVYKPAAVATPNNVVNLLEALRRSVAQSKPGSSEAAAAKEKAARPALAA